MPRKSDQRPFEKFPSIQSPADFIDRSESKNGRSSLLDLITDCTNQKCWPWQDWVVASLLFLAAAAVVFWQNSRLTVLWDLSYILENSHRISLGDVPYRVFPFPYAPLTFLIQAELIKLAGRVFWHHVVYCAVIGGLASV